MDTTGIRRGRLGQELPTDFVQEVQVKSSGYNAEFRATTGGVISAITKTGSNQWRGGGGYYYRSRPATARSSATLRLNPADQTKAEYVVTPTILLQLGADFELGGPMLGESYCGSTLVTCPRSNANRAHGHVPIQRADRDVRRTKDDHNSWQRHRAADAACA